MLVEPLRMVALEVALESRRTYEAELTDPTEQRDGVECACGGAFVADARPRRPAEDEDDA